MREKDYRGHGQAFGGSIFGSGNGPTLIGRIKCKGNETNLGNCKYLLTSEKHEHMAGVDCTGEGAQSLRLSGTPYSLFNGYKIQNVMSFRFKQEFHSSSYCRCFIGAHYCPRDLESC